MTPPFDDLNTPSDPSDDVFAQLLADWDESHGTGESTAALAAANTPLSGDLSDRLHKAQACLKMLKQLWPPPCSGEKKNSVQTGRAYARFGRYEILRELGRGGHGVVFLAIDPALKRQVALKVPLPQVLSSEELSRRFVREAEAAARLDHPNILSIFEVGTDGPVCFTAGAYCDGGTLQDWLAREPSPVDPRNAAEIVLELATAIHHAHTRGVLHRDLKPSNVLLLGRRQEAGGSEANHDSDSSLPLNQASGAPRSNRLLEDWVLKIADFGLAKVADGQQDSTMNGVVLGTVNYMAPEQAAGRSGDVGITSDVYSLGVMLYEMLTGAPPFLAATQLATLQRVERDQAAWPSVLRSRIPADLRTICLTCLEKDPGQRYPNAAALAGDLQRFLRGEPVTARPLSLAERIRRAVQRHPALVMLSAMAACLAIGFVVELVWHNRRLGTVNGGLAKSIEEGKRQSALAQQSLRMAEQQADENRRRSLAADLCLAQQFADAGSLRQFTLAMQDTLSQPGKGEFHEFAWRNLWHRCRGGEYFVLPGHGKHVNDAAFSADGRWIATVSSDFSTRLWDRQTGREQARLYGTQNAVLHVAFSPDSRLLAAGDEQGGVRVWTADDWQLRHILRPHAGPIRGLVFRDDHTLISAAQDDQARVWDLYSAAMVDGRTFTNNREITSLDVSIPRNELLIGFKSGDIQIRALDSINTKTGNLPGHQCEVCGLSTSPQGDVAFSCDVKGNFRLWRLEDRLTVYKSPENLYAFSKTAISPDGGRMAVVTQTAKVQIIDTSGVVQFERQLEIDSVSAFEFSPDGREVLIAGSEGHVALWQPFQQRPPQPQGHRKEAWCVAFAKDGLSFLTGSDDNQVLQWETATGRLLQTIIANQPGTVAALAYSPDNSLLVTTSLEEIEQLPDNVRLWKMPEGKLVRGLAGHTGKVYSAAFHPEGQFFATGSQEVIVWDVRSGTSIATLNDSLATKKKIKSIDFSPDGSLLAFASENGNTYVYNFPELKRRHVLASGSEVWCIAFSPDGNSLASGRSDGDVAIWNPATGTRGRTLRGHLDGVRCLAFAHDGKTIATGSEDNTIKLWGSVTGQEFCTLSGHADDIYAVAFAPDGQWLASCSHDGAVKLWPAPHVPQLGDSALGHRPKEGP